MKSLLPAWRRRAAGQPADDRGPGDVACRNCGADAPGAYCPGCGQETALRLPTAGRFMRDAAGRYVAFDSRMWRTLFALLFRPGFLTREYFAGRRRRYVRPARLVLVLAIVLFAAARLLADPDDVVRVSADPAVAKPAPAAPERANGASRAATTSPTGGTPPAAPGAVAPARRAEERGVVLSLDGEPLTIGGATAGLRIDDALNVHLVGIDVPLGERIERRLESFNRLDRQQKTRELVAGMLRYGPYALIALLPAFALLMQLLYLGRGRRYPQRPRRYAEHLVYGAHNHAFAALVMTLIIAVPYAQARGLLLGWAALYLLLSMRAVYGGRWIGTLARAGVAIVVYAVFFGLAVAGLVLAAVMFR